MKLAGEGNHTKRGRAAFAATTLAATIGLTSAGLTSSAWAAPSGQPLLSQLTTQSLFASTVPVTNTPPQPGDGDVNPYGVAVVPSSEGRLIGGDVLVSNFNDAGNQQGTGRTIVQVSPQGSVGVFARIPGVPGGVGLTTALAVLPNGFVVVGNLPTRDGTSATARRGGLLILDRNGNLVENLHGGDLNGPWDLTAQGFGQFATLYVTNVLNGTVAAKGSPVDGGTVVRLVLDLRGQSPRVLDNTVIASGFPERTDPNALVVGPTGVGLSQNGTLYVADTVDNAIRAIPDAPFLRFSAGTGQPVTSGGALNGPLGLAVGPNGDIFTVNGVDGQAVETTPQGNQVAMQFLDTTVNAPNPPGNGALFGLAFAPNNGGLYFVDDVTNQLILLSAS